MGGAEEGSMKDLKGIILIRRGANGFTRNGNSVMRQKGRDGE
jgi:hypothetical protein